MSKQNETVSSKGWDKVNVNLTFYMPLHCHYRLLGKWKHFHKNIQWESLL